MIHCYARVIADNKFNTLLTIFRSTLAVIMPLICRAELPRKLYNHDNAIPYIHQWTKELQRL